MGEFWNICLQNISRKTIPISGYFCISSTHHPVFLGEGARLNRKTAVNVQIIKQIDVYSAYWYIKIIPTKTVVYNWI